MNIISSPIVTTSHIADGAVTNVKVAATAAIESSKLDLSAVNQVITPDADNTRDLGTAAKSFRSIYVDTAFYINGVDLRAYALQAGILGG